MKHMFIIVFILFLSSGFLVAHAQTGKGSAGWGANSKYCRMYDSHTVETLVGEVLAVERITPAKGMSNGVHVLLKTEKETISVHLGPAWYLDNQDIQIEVTDRIKATGSRITFDEKPALIAAEVTRGEAILKLRDQNGIPVWSGWRRR